MVRDENEMEAILRRHFRENPKLRDILLADVTDRMTSDLAPLVVTGSGEYRRGYTPKIDKRSLWQRVKGIFFGEATPGSW